MSRCHLFPENAEWPVLATLSLYNMLREKSTDTYMPAGYVDFEVEGGDIIPGAWRNEFDATLLKPVVFDKKGCVNPKKRAGYIKKMFTKYFYGPAQVEWQWKKLL